MTIDRIYKSWFRNALKARFARCPLERECLTLGVNEDNGSPFRAPLPLWEAHAHFEGPSGNGKTTGVAVVGEQIGYRPNYSIVCKDLKGDSHELLPALTAGGLPVKWFTDTVGLSTFTFNLFEQKFFRFRSPQQQALLLGGAMGYTHGLAEYGKQWFGGAGLMVTKFILERVKVRNFQELKDETLRFIDGARKTEMPGAIRQAALQVVTDLDRLASVQALNVINNPAGIDLASVYESPQVLYISVPSAIHFDNAGTIARLFMFSLFAAAHRARRTARVAMIIDEFQRAISWGVDVVCQQARSCDVQLMLANQTIADLQVIGKDFRPTVRNSCRIHWQCGEGDPGFAQEIAETSGYYDDVEVSKTYGWFSSNPGSLGTWRATNTTHRKVAKQRLTINDVFRITADPRLSIFRATKDEGLYRYSGYPQIVESDYHLTREEYERRKALPWPDPVEGCIVTEMPSLIEDSPPSRPDDDEPPHVPRIGRPKRR